jgi:CubicO group peptidase (beta-lactamase class C family)
MSAQARTQQQLDSLIQERDELGIQYSAVSDSELLFEYAAGSSDAGSGMKVSAQTQFLSASSTKVITAAAVLKLVDAGALRLGDPVSRYVPYQPYGEGITIAQLLNHSSGVPNPMPLKWVHTQAEHTSYNEDAALRAALASNPKLDFQPGERYGYSNLSYWLLGRVIEAASHTDYTSFVRRELLEPLNITAQDMSFEISASVPQARGHLPRWSLLGLIVPLMAESKTLAASSGKWLRFEHLYMNGPAYGGMRATARGYARFLQDLVQPSSRVLSADSKRLLFTPQTDNKGRALPTTLGFHTGELDGVPYISKPGGGPGFNSNLRIYPSRRLATVYLSNQMRASESSIQRFSDNLDRDLLAARPR